MIDNNPSDWFHNNEVTILLKYIWENTCEGWVAVDQVMWVEKGVVIGEAAFALPKSFNDRMVGPKYPPWQGAGIVHPGRDIKVGQS